MHKIPELIATTVLSLLLSASCSGGDNASYKPRGYSLAQLEEDFDRYVDLIDRDHPKTFTDEAFLGRTIAVQRRLLRAGMTEWEFYGVVAPVGAAVRCGHTRTRLSERGTEYFENNAPCLPAQIRLIEDSLYVYRDFTPDEDIPRGSRVLSINGHTDGEIIRRMRASQYADGVNVTYKDFAINLAFSRLFTMLFGGGERFSLEIAEPGVTEPSSRSVDALTPVQCDSVNKSRYGSEKNCGRLCMTLAADNSHAILTVRDFGYYDNVDAFRKPAADFFARLAENRIGTLILDVRGNDGGDPYCSSFIVSHVIPEPIRYFAAGTRFYDDLVRPIPVPENVFTGDLIVLVDGWCFSSTGHMLSLLKCHNRGVFIGEESGGSAMCNDASKEHVLEHTRLRLNVPRATFATSALCLPPGRGIPPDIRVGPTIDDLIAGRDVVMEKALSLAGSE